MADQDINRSLAEQLDQQKELIDTLNKTISLLTDHNTRLNHVNEELIKTIENLNNEIKDLKEQIAKLLESKNKNSRNSSKPPSSDGYTKPSPTNSRVKTGKKQGAQEGHDGTTMFAQKADRTEVHMPAGCAGCPHYVSCQKNCAGPEVRQVVDIRVEKEIVDHKVALIKNCPIHGGCRIGEFPEQAKTSVQYGINIMALAIALNTVGAVSVNRTHEILNGIFDITLSTGTISSMVSRFAGSVAGTVDNIRKKLQEEYYTHCDETGTRVEGKTWWVHSVSNALYTYMTIHRKRGEEGMKAGGFLPFFRGVIVHDCWSPYWKFGDVIHALCNAHLLRELTGVLENHPDQGWASELKKLLIRIKDMKNVLIEKEVYQFSSEEYASFSKEYDNLIQKAYDMNPLEERPKNKKGRPKRGKVLALIDRLKKYKDDFLRFATDFRIPFDNNQAERDIRVFKIKTKVSGCFRSETGAYEYTAIMSYLGTARKHGVNSFKAILDALSGNPDAIFAIP